jgi:hypothetical protein
MIRFFLHPIIYLLSGIIFAISFYILRPGFIWIGISILLLAIPAWFARKTWLLFQQRQQAALRLEEDFVP